jgi:apolipoprotein N-acyltransferase
MQVTAVTGLYGLSLLTVAFAAMPASLVEPGRDSGPGGRGRWIGTAAAALLFMLAWTGGAMRLSGAGDDTVPGVRLRLVQPNIPQDLKWDPQRLEGNFRVALELSRAPASTAVTHVIWPETAVPFVLAAEPARVAALAAVTPPGGLLVTGAIRAVRLADASVRAWNSLQAVDAEGRIVATYDKFHLVPFGEYVPFRGLLSIAKITPGNLDFTPGPGLVTLDLPGLPPVSPLICYEIIFPDEVALRAPRPAWLLNLTNDAWFGISSGPYQHFAAARFRAVEEGLPVVRAANNGISAVVDPYGRVVARLGLGATGVVDSDLPGALVAPPYARWGGRVPGLLMLVFVVMALLLGRGRRTDDRGL